MKRLYSFTLGFFLLTVRAKKEDFQGYHTEQRKGTTVTKDLLFKNENTIGHGTEAIPKENTHQRTAVTVTATFPEAVLLDTRPTASYERTLITEALAVSTSTIGFASRNRQKSHKSTRENPSALRIHTKSETPLISNYDKIVFSSTQAASESMMNGTSKPEVYLSTDAVKVSLWLHTLLDNRNQRNTDSITPTSADRGPGVPSLSASHPRVIDNPAVLRNDNDDKRSQGKDDKGISNLGRNEYPLDTVQSIFRSDTAADSERGNTLTNLCLTCQKDRGAVSTEKSIALPAQSPDGSSDSLSVEGLAIDFSQFTSSLPSSHQQSAGRQDEIINQDISWRNITEHSSFGVVYNLTFPPSSLNKTVKSILNNYQIKSLLSETRPVAFDTWPPAELSSATQNDTKKLSGPTYPSDPISTTTAFYRSSNSLYTAKKQETLGKKVSVGDPLSKLIYVSKHNRNTSRNLSTNLKNGFVENHSLDLSNKSDIAEAASSKQKSVLPDSSDHSDASHPTARMRLIEDHSTVASFSLSRPTTFAVKNPESHSLTGRADPVISVLRSQTLAEPSSKTKEPIWTLLQRTSTIRFTSVTTSRQLTGKQASQTFNTVNSIGKHYFVDPSWPSYQPLMKETQTPTLTTRKVVVPVNFFLSESRRDFDEDVSMSTLTTLSSKSYSERLTMSRPLGSQSKKPQERTFDVSSDSHEATAQQSFLKYNRDLIRDSLRVHNVKLGDKNEQELTVVAVDEDKEIVKAEGNHGENIKETKEILKLWKEEESREDEKLENKREGLFRPDKTENRKQEKNNKTGVDINQNTDREGDTMEEHEAKPSREEGAGTVRQEDITLRQDQDPRQGEVRDEEGSEKKAVTKMITNNSTKDVAEKQRVSLTKEGAEARKEEPSSKENITCHTEIVRGDMTNVPLGPTTNSKELNRDKGHTVTNLSSCHSLIKQLGAPKYKCSHLGENITQIVEIKNRPFSYKVTSNHRQLHSTVRSQRSELSRITSFPKETRTQIQSHPFTLRTVLTKYGVTSSPTKESAQNKVVEAKKMLPKLSQAFGVSTLKFSNALKPTISPQNSATRSAHPVLKGIGNALSLTSPGLATTAEVLRAQPHFTGNSSTRSVSIIYSISDHKQEFSTLVSKANALLPTMKEEEQAEHILDSSDKDNLTSNMIEEVKTSTSVNLAPAQQMYDDSSTRPPTAAALSSVAHTSISQPQQRQSTTQTSKSTSSSFDMTSGKPFSFKRSEQTAHSNALHAPADDNKQRSVESLMASMSPKAKNDQFPLSSMFPLPNLLLFGDDSLPGTYSLTGLTRAPSEKEILRANAGTEYANSGSGHAESLLGTADKTNQTKKNDSVQRMVSSGVKHAVTKQKAESSSPFIDQIPGSSKPHDSNTEELNSLSLLQTEKLAVKNTHNHNDLFNVHDNDEANNTVKTTLENNQLSQLGGHNGTSSQSIMSAIQTTHKIEQAINEDVAAVTNDFAVTVLNTNDRTVTTAFVESDSLPELSHIQANDVTNNVFPDMEGHAATPTEKQHDPSPPRGAVVDNVPPINFGTDPKIPNISTQQIDDQIINVTSEFQITTTKTNDFVSLAQAASASGFIASTEVHESALTTSESVQIVTKRSSQQAAHAERMVQSYSHIEPSSLREPPTTATAGQLTPAVKRRNTTETQSVEQSERDISDHVSEQSQHAPPGMTAITRCFSDLGQSIQAGLLKAALRAGGPHDKRVEYSSFKDIKTTLRTKMAFEAKHPVHEITPRVHILDGADQHKTQAVPEKISISRVILAAVTESVPHTEIIHKTSCRTIGCIKSSEMTETTIGAGDTDHTGRENIYKTQAGNTGRDHFNAVHPPDTKTENGNCSTDRPVPGKVTPQATNLDYAALSPPTGESDRDQTTVDNTRTKNVRSVMDETLTGTWRVLIETDHLERRGELEQPRPVEETTQRHSHRQSANAQDAVAIEVTLSESEATTVQTTVKTTEWTLLTKINKTTKLNRGAAKAELFEAQYAIKSARAVAKEEPAVRESGHRFLLPEPVPESELPRQKHGRRSSPHLYLSGVTEVSDELCGSGDYTAEMSLNLGSDVEPGDAVPALGNVRVVINLKTNSSRINLKVTSCCLSPTIQPDHTNSTCCIFSRLAAEPAWITLLPSALSTSASFTIRLFQMINYSVVYLHCDLSVCLRNRSDCERQCLQQRSAFPLEGPEAADTNHRNRISFGPMLKEVKNSTFPGEIDRSELDLVLVIVSLLFGSSLVTVALLLVWLAYRRRAIWLLHSVAPPQACCGCLHPGGDLILP